MVRSLPKCRHMAPMLGMAALAATAVAAVPVHAAITNGFSNPGNWTFNSNSASSTNGVPAMSGGDLTLTSASIGESSSAWYGTPQDVSDSWTATFTW